MTTKTLKRTAITIACLATILAGIYIMPYDG
ncbi:hypothetical protein J2S23_001810 [Streptococcus moroccensis]|uniref:ECF transporter S component n=1 Tax=Streptococcus moroccensis TaxID=1451356 RepID=A0ABT9YVY9_9STRE|nr:hypothetical protein [Streptococcus moroccensis]